MLAETNKYNKPNPQSKPKLKTELNATHIIPGG